MKYPKLHLACSNDELRPIMNYVLINKQHVVATDGVVLVQHSTPEWFDEEFINKISDDGILIHKDDFQKISNKDILDVRFKSDDIIKITFSKKERPLLIETLKNKSGVGTFPNYLAAIPNIDNIESVDKIGVNPDTLLKLRDAISCNENAVSMYFYGLSRAILVNVNECEYKNYKALIMPVLIR